MNKSVSILGSTGSIGRQALEVAKFGNYKIRALTAFGSVELLEKQIREFKPETAAAADEKAAADLTVRVADTPTKILSGIEGVCECAAMQADVVLNSVVGIAGLTPTLAAINAGNTLALANKESLVTGGELVMAAAKKNGVDILPVDSEHCAVFQSLAGCNDRGQIKRLILTASGGPFFGKNKEELKSVTAGQALKHPNWSMGEKITIDSATMMNKGLELTEARWLFDVPAEKIDILIHRQSVVHSLVEYVDGSVIAQLGVPDMRIPIQYALTYPDRHESPAQQLRLEDYGRLTFETPDYETFIGIDLCKRACSIGGLYSALVNGANEQANLLFRQGRIAFLQIGEAVEYTLDNIAPCQPGGVEEIFETDRIARQAVNKFFRIETEQ